MKTGPRTIDDYLATVDAEKRAALERLRNIIRAAAPKAAECISYQLPAFRLDGRLLMGFGAAAKHCALYPMSGATVAEFQHQLRDYQTSKGTIRFQPGRPLPVRLLRKLVKARIRENQKQQRV
jgi:uncharacterized protein YdhG (YjbR/CyaY superfamily)